MRVRGTVRIDGPHALQGIVLELDHAALELGMLCHELLEEVIHLAVSGDVVGL